MKRIAVVGATGTVGSAVATAFEARGDEVVRLSRSSHPSIDLSDEDTIETCLAALAPLDAIVCAAGDARFGPLPSSPDSVFELGLTGKLMGQVRLTRLGLRHLVPGGAIVLTSGLLAYRFGQGTAPVSMVNAAVETFVRAAALDLDGHRLLAVSPPMLQETAVKMGRRVGPWAAPASLVAEAYLAAVDGSDSGEICFVEGHAPSRDARPLPATGHLFLRARDARAAAARLTAVGVREIAIRDGFAVLELRGGTHIVVRDAPDAAVIEAPFDLMYDDLDATWSRFQEQGFDVTAIETGRIHRSFYATAPEGFRVQVLDSHVGDRFV